jgi:hypothetical protein
MANNKLCLQTEEWERILSASGGKLESTKCLAYIVVYNWNKVEPLQHPKLEILTQLLVCNTETQQQTHTPIKDPAESHKTLGTFQTPLVTWTNSKKPYNKGKQANSILLPLKTTNLQSKPGISLNVYLEPTIPTGSQYHVV